MNTQYESAPAPQTVSSRLYRADLEEMLRGPLSNLFWGTIETSAVMEALERAESFLRRLEMRQTRMMQSSENQMFPHMEHIQAA